MELFANLLTGFETSLQPVNLFYCFVGVVVGTAVGVLPGLGPLATLSMLLPLTYALDPVSALIMLSGIYYGAQYGGSTTAILVNLPGEASSVVTAIDGHKMATAGRAGAALAIAALASVFAGTISTFFVAASLSGPREGRSFLRTGGLLLADGRWPRCRGHSCARLAHEGDRHGAGGAGSG